ncbi:MAG: Na+ dependent nucleoside transporter [Bacteroidetes bacterium]|nr:Na+ dependent nucleoside transporter [Bacteroidota bacterium]
MVDSLLRGLLGLFFLLGVCYLLSNNRKKIDWKLVFTGILIQIIFAILVTKVPFVRSIFEVFANFFRAVTDFTNAGTIFLFSSFFTGKVEGPVMNFAFRILPTIVFFSALSSLLYYLGILQKIVYGLAWVMSKTMRLSGAESLSAAANIFMGQTEAPLLVKPYIAKMTDSELLCLMTGGMATIAGGVLAAYIGFLGGDSKEMQILFATHLLTASIMSAPAAIVASKMIFPETKHDEVVKEINLNKEQIGENALEAISIGTGEGLKLAINVGGMLLVFIALIAMVNAIFGGLGGLHMKGYMSLNDIINEASNGRFPVLSLEYLFGIAFAPLAWILGVPTSDIMQVGRLLGEKTIINEFVAYGSLGQMKAANLFASEKSVIIATYALCGFSNIASIGIQIGGIGAMAPNKRATLAKLGVRALLAGSIACFITAVLAGILSEF